ncbi:MAG: phosphoenolpyruvate synthase [Gammaproteobacteria bacterium]|nr:MAG: phosphoenolpyruvate synthase [Gammaproteobacteria bacterium]
MGNISKYILWFDEINLKNLPQVGGKNSSLGEMINLLSDSGITVPGGFATTSDAFWYFIQQTNLNKKINDVLDNLDVHDVLALKKAGSEIRQWILDATFPEELKNSIREAYQQLAKKYGDSATYAVRSSATAEDLANASFAGQQETYLNIQGEDATLKAIQAVFASLYNDRAISYRVHHGFEHHNVALSAGIQLMIRSDLASSGVMFTLDTESGFEDVIFITSSYGLGETIVQGSVNPDEFYVYKPSLEKNKSAILRRNIGSKKRKMIFTESNDHQSSTNTIDVEISEQNKFSLTDKEIIALAAMGLKIEKHYGKAMDIEWAKDGLSGEIYIVQARPETVKSRDNCQVLERYEFNEPTKQKNILVSGRSVGQRIGHGNVRVILNASEMDQLIDGEVLVTDMTDPDWEPVMKRASAIVTNRGGRTCHAAIIARELGVPAVVGTTDASKVLKNGQTVTVSCNEGDEGLIYEGIQEFKINKTDLKEMPELPFKIMLNVATPDRAFDFSFLPNHGVGLARLEFIIARSIGIHPKALLQYNKQPQDIKDKIDERIKGYADPVSFYIEKLTEGIATIAAAFSPKPVIVRLSDFKSNEYANLIGGKNYEPHEENPMLGFRGASRYIDKKFQDCFELECFAIKKARDDMGLTNIAIMVPFVRTPEEAHEVTNLLKENDLARGENDLKIMMMCEIPSNALLAEKFLKYFDGFSIGSNDMTQLTLGLDRDSELVADRFDERNEAVKSLLSMAIRECKMKNKYIGICGQGPSDHPDFAYWLMEQGIHSVSLNPDSVIETWLYLAENAKQ